MTTTATTPTKPGGYEAPPPDKKNLSVTLTWPNAKPAKANETWNIHVPKVGRAVLLLTSLFCNHHWHLSDVHACLFLKHVVSVRDFSHRRAAQLGSSETSCLHGSSTPRSRCGPNCWVRMLLDPPIVFACTF
jgi:hypothetical protein